MIRFAVNTNVMNPDFNQNDIFSNLKVIELASVLAGPSVGQFMAELGADVIKIENPKTKGDVTRSWKLKSEDETKDTCAYFASANWGKKHLFKNLKDASEKAEVLALIKEADVVITSYKPGDGEKLGLDYHSLKSLNSRIIYGNITGYGDDDPRAGYDAIIQAETGFMYMNGDPGDLPTKLPVAITDIFAAHQLKQGILLALLRREKTGEGSNVEISLFEAGISALANQGTNYLVANHVPVQMGSDHPNIVPYGTVFRSADEKYLVLAVGNDHQFKELCGVLGMEDWASDNRFSTNPQRVHHREELKFMLTQEISKHSRTELLTALQNKKVPAGAVNNMEELFAIQKAKGMTIDYGYDNLTGIKNVAFKIS